MADSPVDPAWVNAHMHSETKDGKRSVAVREFMAEEVRSANRQEMKRPLEEP
jgi:hypothetical protein